MVRALPYVIPIALALFALIDLSRSTSVERAEIHPAAWVAIIVLLPVIGPVAWIAVSRQRAAAARSAGTAGPSRPGPARPKPRRTGPVAPDDDPDFLWRLEQDRRRRAKGAAGAEGADGHAPGDGPGTPGPDADDGTPAPPAPQ